MPKHLQYSHIDQLRNIIMGKRKQDLGDVPMGGTKDEESSDDVSAQPAL